MTKLFILVPKGTGEYPESFSWWWGHKARIGIYLLSIIYMSRLFAKNKLEYTFVCLGSIVIVYFSNSLTSLTFTVIYILILQYQKSMSYFKKIKMFLYPFLLVISIPILLLIYQKISEERNIYSFGGRFFLWGIAFNSLWKDPIAGHGEIKKYFTDKDIVWLAKTIDINKKIGISNIQLLGAGGSHNNFIEEGRISGLISMALLFLLFLILFFKFPADFRVIYFMILFFLMMEVVLTTHFVYYFFTFLSFVLAKEKHYLCSGIKNNLTH